MLLFYIEAYAFVEHQSIIIKGPLIGITKNREISSEHRTFILDKVIGKILLIVRYLLYLYNISCFHTHHKHCYKLCTSFLFRSWNCISNYLQNAMRHLGKMILLPISTQLAWFSDLHFGGWAVPYFRGFSFLHTHTHTKTGLI